MSWPFSFQLQIIPLLSLSSPSRRNAKKYYDKKGDGEETDETQTKAPKAKDKKEKSAKDKDKKTKKEKKNK